MALHEGVVARKVPVIGNELRVRNSISIQKHQVMAPGSSDRLVEDACAAKSLVFLPNMKARLGVGRQPFSESRAGLFIRAIVCQQNFIGQGTLNSNGV